MIIRSPKNNANSFMKLDKEFLNNKNLSWKAKGLLGCLLSLPDDYIFSEKAICSMSIDGKESTSKGIKELVKNGYIQIKKIKCSNGRFNGVDYIIFEKPLYDFDKPIKCAQQQSKSELDYNKLINSYSKEKINKLKNMPYSEYLKTPHWKNLSQIVKSINKKTCFYCGENKNVSLNAHHKTYERKGHENLSDLICICSNCHNLIHKEEKENKIYKNLNKGAKS